MRVNENTGYVWLVATQQKYEAVASNVARLLREERERQKLSMTVLAERAGLSQQMVSYVEREMRNPTLETLLRITGVLGVELADVIRQASGSGSGRKR